MFIRYRVETDGKIKKVIGENATYEAKSVIVATGSKHRKLGAADEEKFVGTGISYCAVCDGAFYKDKEVAVIGGGNTALQEAVMLSELCKKVTLVQNLSFFTGEKKLLNQLEKKDNVEFITSSVVCGLEGEDTLSAIKIKNTETNEETTLSVNGIFVAVGQAPENEPFRSVASLDEYGYIVSGEECESGTQGIFVAGDCRTKRVRQIATAVSDGAVLIHSIPAGAISTQSVSNSAVHFRYLHIMPSRISSDLMSSSYVQIRFVCVANPALR